MLVFILALQNFCLRSARPPVGGLYFFANAIGFVRLGAIGKCHRQKVENEYQAGSRLIPQRVGNAFSGGQELVAQPADVFPQNLPAATGIADFKHERVDVHPHRTFWREVASNLEDYWVHDSKRVEEG